MNLLSSNESSYVHLRYVLFYSCNLNCCDLRGVLANQARLRREVTCGTSQYFNYLKLKRDHWLKYEYKKWITIESYLQKRWWVISTPESPIALAKHFTTNKHMSYAALCWIWRNGNSDRNSDHVRLLDATAVNLALLKPLLRQNTSL